MDGEAGGTFLVGDVECVDVGGEVMYSMLVGGGIGAWWSLRGGSKML